VKSPDVDLIILDYDKIELQTDRIDIKKIKESLTFEAFLKE
jgi:hypothetical protein